MKTSSENRVFPKIYNSGNIGNNSLRTEEQKKCSKMLSLTILGKTEVSV